MALTYDQALALTQEQRQYPYNTLAHDYAMQQALPADFPYFHMRNYEGTSVAEIALLNGSLPANFSQWQIPGTFNLPLYAAAVIQDIEHEALTHYLQKNQLNKHEVCARFEAEYSKIEARNSELQLDSLLTPRGNSLEQDGKKKQRKEEAKRQIFDDMSM